MADRSHPESKKAAPWRALLALLQRRGERRRGGAGKIEGDEAGRGYLLTTFTCALVALMSLALFGTFSVADGWQILALAVIVGLGAFWVAGLIGFVFGVSAVEIDRNARVQPLVEISDWLTKILVGVGLVEVRSLGDALGNAGEFFGSATELPGANQVFSAFIVVEAACGFWFLYFWTSMRWAALTARARHAVNEENAKSQVRIRKLSAGAQPGDAAST